MPLSVKPSTQTAVTLLERLYHPYIAYATSETYCTYFHILLPMFYQIQLIFQVRVVSIALLNFIYNNFL